MAELTQKGLSSRDSNSLVQECAKSLQSCPTLCDPIDGSPPGSPVPGILQARTLEWVAISFSNAWKWKVKVKSLSHVWFSDPMDCSLPGSSIHGIFQVRVQEWGAIAFSEEWGVLTGYSGRLSKITCSGQLYPEIRQHLAALCIVSLSLNRFPTHDRERILFVGPAKTPKLDQMVDWLGGKFIS